jgi:hypothetical protein
MISQFGQAALAHRTNKWMKDSFAAEVEDMKLQSMENINIHVQIFGDFLKGWWDTFDPVVAPLCLAINQGA